jgi:hypothetical protein
MNLSNKEFNYQLNCSEYVLHDGEKPIGPLLKEVSIAFDFETGTLHKHGSSDGVQKWYDKTKKGLTDSGLLEMANDLVMISGRFPLDELNKCLSTSGYVKKMFSMIQDGKIEADPEFPEQKNISRMRP